MSSSETPRIAITTADNESVAVGNQVFNYYDRKVGIITAIEFDGWFELLQNDGTKAFLNGERICTMQFAAARGWITNTEGI